MPRAENPLSCKTAEAMFARKAGWQVVWDAPEHGSDTWIVIPPKSVAGDCRLRWTFQSLEAAWGVAAQRAGYRPLERKEDLRARAVVIQARQGQAYKAQLADAIQRGRKDG